MTEYERKGPRERSMSGDYESDFEGSAAGDGNTTSAQPGKPGRKKNPNSQAARRDQNRIAQREFRLRKQQRIRDLEARVEILSGGKEEAIGEMRNMIKDLMAENHNLRQMLRSLASFIGEGMGGVLPKIGWEQRDFDTFLNKGETDTAWEGYQARKKGADSRPAGGPSSSMPPIATQKRPSEGDILNSRKKPRNDPADVERGHPNGFNMMGPMGSNNIFPPDSDRNAGMFGDLMGRGPSQPMFTPPSASPSSSMTYGNMSNSLDNYNNPYLGMSMNHQPVSAGGYDSAATGPSQSRVQPPPPNHDDEELDEDDPNKSEAYKLIRYHLDNYRRNPAYCLPSSLRPSSVQRTIPHQSTIDCVIHPEMRDRMILFKDKYDLVDCLIDWRRATTIHGDDVLAHSNWEVGEAFFRKYPFLTEAGTLAVANRWRKERGEPELRISDYEQNPHA
ncbi:hypothetical protein BKA70DRAFT_1258439 [Coprinopsis sp. MPI-PUGE-AT-0042]|nr:hypothetical protein BKA70DRAFT_1258439 [Coprinopsis sp. MPI-PUGE-AT-0042]